MSPAKRSQRNSERTAGTGTSVFSRTIRMTSASLLDTRVPCLAAMTRPRHSTFLTCASPSMSGQ